MQITEIHT